MSWEENIPWFVWVSAGLVGAAVGSFLNVCIYRLPRGGSLIKPRSHCPKCGSPIKPYDNIPIISFFLLRGKCRNCLERISPRYPMVEALTAVAALALMQRYGLSSEALLLFAFVCGLFVASFIDLDHQIIPDAITYPGIAIGIGASFLFSFMSPKDSLLGAGVGAGVLLTVSIVFRVIRKKEGMGLGDVKFLGMIGAFLGWKAVILTLVLSSFVGAVVGYLSLRLSGKGSHEPIPFGPFLALGALIYIFAGEQLIDWYLSLGGRQ